MADNFRGPSAQQSPWRKLDLPDLREADRVELW
jgi:hypothetical protein